MIEHSKVLNYLVALTKNQINENKPFVWGISGNIASGKSTFATQLRQALSKQLETEKIQIVSTDNFLYENKILQTKQLTAKKGFPQSHDDELMQEFIVAVQQQAKFQLPIYSQKHKNLLPQKKIQIDQPTILILEGLMALQMPLHSLVQHSIFLNSRQEANFSWYLNRAKQIYGDKFEVSLPHINEAWQQINLPNYQQNVAPTKDYADIIINFNHQHQITAITNNKGKHLC